MRDEEHQHQVAVILWWAYVCKGYGLPGSALFAVPNGGARSKRTAGRLKAEGVRPGIPDLILPVARGIYRGLVVEMKSRVGRISPAQVEVLAWFESIGWRAVVCRSAEPAMDEITSYLRGKA